MGWNIFKRGDQERKTGARWTGPKDLPPSVGRDLVVDYQEDPDWVWKLKCVQIPHRDHPTRMDFRVFSGAHASNVGVVVKDFHSLDGHPDLILFFGWLDKKNFAAEVFRGPPSEVPAKVA